VLSGFSHCLPEARLEVAAFAGGSAGTSEYSATTVVGVVETVGAGRRITRGSICRMAASATAASSGDEVIARKRARGGPGSRIG